MESGELANAFHYDALYRKEDVLCVEPESSAVLADVPRSPVKIEAHDYLNKPIKRAKANSYALKMNCPCPTGHCRQDSEGYSKSLSGQISASVKELHFEYTFSA